MYKTVWLTNRSIPKLFKVSRNDNDLNSGEISPFFVAMQSKKYRKKDNNNHNITSNNNNSNNIES